jgi:glutathione S-transferase
MCEFFTTKRSLAPPVGDPARGRYLRWLFFSPGCVEQAFLVKSANVSVRQDAAGFGDFGRVFDVLEATVATGPWLLGERFSAADVMIGLDLHFGIDIFKLVRSRPALRGYVDRCFVRPAPQRTKAIEAARV